MCHHFWQKKNSFWFRYTFNWVKSLPSVYAFKCSVPQPLNSEWSSMNACDTGLNKCSHDVYIFLLILLIYISQMFHFMLWLDIVIFFFFLWLLTLCGFGHLKKPTLFPPTFSTSFNLIITIYLTLPQYIPLIAFMSFLFSLCFVFMDFQFCGNIYFSILFHSVNNS